MSHQLVDVEINYNYDITLHPPSRDEKMNVHKNNVQWNDLWQQLWNFFCWSHTPMCFNLPLKATMVSMFGWYKTNTTTKEGYIAIQISSQTTKKKVSENPQLRTTISRKLLSYYETITFAPVQSQVLRNSRNWYNRKTFPIIISSIHHLQFPVHRKLFATNPSPQRLSEST